MDNYKQGQHMMKKCYRDLKLGNRKDVTTSGHRSIQGLPSDYHRSLRGGHLVDDDTILTLDQGQLLSTLQNPIYAENTIVIAPLIVLSRSLLLRTCFHRKRASGHDHLRSVFSYLETVLQLHNQVEKSV
jgi:hypothetical protein